MTNAAALPSCPPPRVGHYPDPWGGVNEPPGFPGQRRALVFLSAAVFCAFFCA
ncbi:hypothetical protein P355_1385 [Burkholderia cenocepacia KC-01]|nr:hypothetical protein P355_1385 [Burkholderia cenocepacia KC-01]